jgi:hypothetical protein
MDVVHALGAVRGVAAVLVPVDGEAVTQDAGRDERRTFRRTPSFMPGCQPIGCSRNGFQRIYTSHQLK